MGRFSLFEKWNSTRSFYLLKVSKIQLLFFFLTRWTIMSVWPMCTLSPWLTGSWTVPVSCGPRGVLFRQREQASGCEWVIITSHRESHLNMAVLKGKDEVVIYKIQLLMCPNPNPYTVLKCMMGFSPDWRPFLLHSLFVLTAPADRSGFPTV